MDTQTPGTVDPGADGDRTSFDPTADAPDEMAPAAATADPVREVDPPAPDAAAVPAPVDPEPSPSDFRVDVDAQRGAPGWGPTGPSRRASDNVAALRLLRTLQAEQRPATPAEQDVLGRWTSWGALPKVFDESAADFAEVRAQVHELLDEREWSAARRTTVNAHYTSPAYVAAMWNTLHGLGFEGGDVLEPGCGAGVFMGVAPTAARVTGVELDPVTAAIAGYLYPSSTVRAESFTDSPFPDETFDAVIGNVPFSDVHLLDPNHNPGQSYSMHNHFILKSLALTRPGGVVAVLTSRYTLDAVDDSARRDMLQMADLVTAVRLPSGAHRHVAGTEAVTDLLVFRVRREGTRPPGPLEEPSWVQTTEVDVPRKENPDETVEVDINGWFVEHPDLVLGDLQVGHGMYNAETVQVTAEDLATVGDRLQTVLAGEVQRAHEARLVFTPTDPERVRPQIGPVARAGDPAAFEGHISREDDGTWWQMTSGVREPLKVPKSADREMRELIGLRDIVVQLLSAEAASAEDNAQTADLRGRLNAAYDAYVDRFGPINRVKVTVGPRVRESDGKLVVTRRYHTAAKVFRSDPHAATVQALEDYDEVSGTARKVAIMSRRVVQVRQAPTTADTPQDAVALSLDQTGEVRLDVVAAMLGTDTADAREQLGQLVFDDPGEPDRLVPAAEYLSGNVREALATARDAAATMPEFEVNVAALEKVLPVDRQPEEIVSRLGSVWIPDTDVQAFLRETLGDPRLRVLNVHGSEWEVRGNKNSQAATTTWGTERMDAVTMTQRLLQQQSIVIKDSYTDGNGNDRVYVNKPQTDAAQDKAQALQTRFGEWVLADRGRATRLAAEYNQRFNSQVLRSYEQDGAALTLPGLASGFNPHPWQRAAVARMRAEPSVGLFHEVGAGKTAEMIIGTSELKRLGMVRKPLVIMPNNMLGQFTTDWLGLYPQARVLTAGADEVKPENRRRFVARAATGEWDAVLMTHSAFKSISVSPDTQEQYMARELEALRASLDRNSGDQAFARSVKRIETKIMRTEERLKKKIEATERDEGVTFEQMGVDYLVVDELHQFKNLSMPTKMQNVLPDGSYRATDLDMKLSWLREQAGPRGRVMTGATATPIANSIAEAYVMQRYLRPELLEAAGIDDFDSWAATFAQEHTGLEMRPDGGGFRPKTRLARYQNVPDLLRMFHVFADVKTAADLPLDVPNLKARADGTRAPEVVLVEPSPEQEQMVQDIIDRTERVAGGMEMTRASGKSDNHATLSGDGRKTALDIRMVTGEFRVWADQSEDPVELDPSIPSKLDAVADRVARIWAQHRDTFYPVAAGSEELHPKPGAAQIVFLDLGTPTGTSWNAYAELRDQLTTRGMDPARIAFAHDAEKDQEKARLFAAARNGDLDVIVGSTQKMGVGTNMQLRAVALHHVDCPWRPDEVAQREGRIVRQGNANDEVQILRYATKQSFDGYMWQTVERKAAFIDQFMHGTLNENEVEEVQSSQQLSAAEMTAAIADNPLLFRQMELKNEVARLTSLETSHGKEQARRRQQVVTETNRIDRFTTTVIPTLQTAIDTRVDTSGDRFTAIVAGTRFGERADAASAIRHQVLPQMQRLDKYGPRELSMPGLVQLGGHTFDAVAKIGLLGQEPWVEFTAQAAPDRVVTVDQSSLGDEGIGVISRLEKRLTALDRDLAAARVVVDDAQRELAEAESGIGKPFQHAEALEVARRELEEVREQMAAQDPEGPEGADTDDESVRADAPSTAPPSTAPQAGDAQQGTRPAQQRSQAEVNAEGIARVRQKVADLRSAQQERQDDAAAAAGWRASQPERLDQTHPQYQREGRIQITGRRGPGHGPRM